ncbi:MAG: relaxase/mobilization nuclease domain-containing protein [Pararhodobacter sp.]|nr:relaxase/mobilization nuclease domain-containing protein [Pararhodobacter sp.]
MMIRFFRHGQGGGGPAIDYLLAKEVPAFDSERRRIPGKVETRNPLPEILRGNAERTVHLIDSITRKWRYTSGVVAFAAEDQPTQEELDAVMDGFERAAFAGLETDQYDCLWVQHVHKGNVELHFVVPRTELYDGASFNIAPPRSESYFNAVRDYWNCVNGWASPNDPDRRRMLKPVFESKDRAEIRAAIREYIVAKIETGKVRNHQDVLAALADLNDVGLEVKPPRPSKKIPKKPTTKVVVKRVGTVGTQETYRLEDRIFHEEWTADEYFHSENQRENRTGARSVREPDLRRAERLRRKLEVAVDRRAKVNRKRYEECRRSHASLFGHDREGHRETGETRGADHGRDAGTASSLGSAEAMEVNPDASWDWGVGGDHWGVRGIHDSPTTDREKDRNSAAPERAGTVSEGDGARRRGDGTGSAGRGDTTAMPADDANGSPMRENTKNGELNHGLDPSGARIAEVRQSVNRALQQNRDCHQAFSRQDRDGDTARHGSFGRVREVRKRDADPLLPFLT